MRRVTLIVTMVIVVALLSVGLATAQESEVVWSGERIDDWYSTANSGQAFIEDVIHPALGPALRLVNENVDGSHNAGARINQQGFGSDRVLPTEAWYAATYLVPYFIDGQDNVFQFKQGDGSTRRHLWNVGWRPVDGELRFIIRTRLEGSTWQSRPDELALLDATVPIGVPFRLEVFRRISTGADGRYEVRIDGRSVWEFDGPTAAADLDPRPAGNHEWVISHYLGSHQGEVAPATSEIYVTDATVATTAGSGPAPVPVSFNGRFWDDDGSVHEGAIEHLAGEGVVSGCNPPSNDRFCVDRTVTRAEYVAMLVRATGGVSSTGSTFPDVSADAWYAGAVATAAERGIVVGHTDGTFRPFATVTRAEAAAMLARSQGWQTSGGGSFVDVSPSAWYSGDAEVLYSNDVTRGCAVEPLRFCPESRITRGEAASFVSAAVRG